ARDHEKEPLQAWVQAAQFDFDPFIGEEEGSNKPRKPPSESKPKSSRDRGSREASGQDMNFMPVVEDGSAGEEQAQALDDFGTVQKVEPSLLQKQLRSLEESFLALEGGLDTPERQEMWHQLATLNAQLGSVDDGGVCWMNALWERDESAVRKWAWGWFLTEASVLATRSDAPRGQPRSWVQKAITAGAKVREVPGEDLDRLLKDKEPATAD